jgi:methionyl aminopeptidase
MKVHMQATGIILKSPQELAVMRRAGKIVAATIEALVQSARPGTTTGELDALAEEEIRRRGAVPSFKGYRGFKASICTSINEEIVHGIPGPRVLKDGDILGLDVGAYLEGFHADSAVTIGIGDIGPQAQKLIEVTRTSLEAGIQAARAGNRLGDISWAIQQVVEREGFSVVREYVGHGIGRNLHEEPPVPNYGQPGKGVVLQKGLALALEPMVNIGTWRTRLLSDGWTVVTDDGTLSGHFEHTIAITEGEAEVLTRP